MPKERQKVDLLNKLAVADKDHEVQHAVAALKLAESLDYLYGAAKAAEILGKNAFDLEDYDKAFHFFEISNNHYQTLEDIEGQLRTLKELNFTTFNLREFDKTIDYCLQMQHLADSAGNKSYLAYSYKKLGRIRGEIMGDQKGSREYSFKAIELYNEIGEKASISGIYSNIGISYYLDRQLDSSMFYLQQGNYNWSGIPTNKRAAYTI